MKYKEVIRIIKEDGWYFVRQAGSHQQYHHLVKNRTVTFAGKPKEDIPREL